MNKKLLSICLGSLMSFSSLGAIAMEGKPPIYSRKINTASFSFKRDIIEELITQAIQTATEESVKKIDGDDNYRLIAYSIASDAAKKSYKALSIITTRAYNRKLGELYADAYQEILTATRNAVRNAENNFLANQNN